MLFHVSWEFIDTSEDGDANHAGAKEREAAGRPASRDL